MKLFRSGNDGNRHVAAPVQTPETGTSCVTAIGLLVALAYPASAAGQGAFNQPAVPLTTSRPELQVGRNSFAMPVIEYRASDGVIRQSRGIIIGRDVAPNANVGLGFYKMSPKFDYPPSSVTDPLPRKSKKVAVGVTLKF